MAIVGCGASCTDRGREDAAARVEFLEFSSDCFDSCGLISLTRNLQLEVAAGSQSIDASIEWMASPDSNRVIATAPVTLGAGEETTIQLREESEDALCSPSDGETRTVTVFVELDGELFELTGDAGFGGGWGEC